ncbi:MAG: AIPR family protein [Candidatus Omnitrophica bacterium]|nr:AIPR family protein [Candidatus Omnitrophota bacterium]
MKKNFDIALNAKINEFERKFNLDRNKLNVSDIFEKFSNYVIISNELEDELEELNKVSTNKAQGIDGIGIIVNDKLIADESDLERIGEDEKIKVKIVFIQSTTESSFDSSKFSTFVDTVIQFLLGELKIEPFSSIYDKFLSEESDFINNLKETPEIVLYYSSGRTEHNIDNSLLDAQKNKIINREEMKNKILFRGIKFLQKDELKTLYEKIPSYQEILVEFAGHIQLEEKGMIQMSLLSYIKFEELKKLILTKDGNLKENLFIENPRAFLGETKVNQDIKETLKDDNYRNFFIYLNNGLTILCNGMNRHPTSGIRFYLQYPRIINGCQTTHVLYEIYKTDPEKLKDLELTVKVIATNDDNLKEKIIFAANNQNSISEDLRALNEYQKKIEEYFKGVANDLGLCYERLRGQYPSISPPYKKISIENLAKVYISVFLQEPHKMKSNAISKIDEYQKKKRIFNPDDAEINKYYYCALLYYWFNKFLTNNEIKLKSKTMDMHLLLICDLQLSKISNVGNDTDMKVQYLASEEKAREIFNNSISFIESQNYLFERRGLYSSPKTKQMIQQFG